MASRVGDILLTQPAAIGRIQQLAKTMPPTETEFKPVSRITIGAVGDPGHRVFYLQACKEEQLLTLIVEKEQVQTLAIGVEKFMQDLKTQFPELPDAGLDLDESALELQQPLEPAFRVGQIGLGYDHESDLVLLVARELQPGDAEPEESSVARLWCTRHELRAMCQHGLDISSRGRPICGNCGEPIDPEGHFCPKRNGHRR